MYRDPSGFIITEGGIESGDYVYSCNCGWIDFHHAQPNTGRQILDLVSANPNPYTGPLTIFEDWIRITARSDIPVTIGGEKLQITYSAAVKQNLPDKIQEKVAFAIYMKLENIRESLAILRPGGGSSFSEEDLASDIIGFYCRSSKSLEQEPEFLVKTSGLI